MAKKRKVSVSQIIRAVERDDYSGFCLACGHEQGGCEPDAQGYECERCGELEVYGAEELLLMRYEPMSHDDRRVS